MSYYQFDNSHRRTLFLGDLPYECTELDLIASFSRFGEVVDVKIKRGGDRSNNRRLPFGLIKFANHDMAEFAMNQMDGKILRGKELKINWSDSKYQVKATPAQATSSASVHVTYFSDQLENTVTRQSLTQIFSSYGQVIHCCIKKSTINPAQSTQTGYGFIHFTNDLQGMHAALWAVENLDNAVIQRVNYKCNVSGRFYQQLEFLGAPTNRSIAATNFDHRNTANDDYHKTFHTIQTTHKTPQDILHQQQHYLPSIDNSNPYSTNLPNASFNQSSYLENHRFSVEQGFKMANGYDENVTAVRQATEESVYSQAAESADSVNNLISKPVRPVDKYLAAMLSNGPKSNAPSATAPVVDQSYDSGSFTGYGQPLLGENNTFGRIENPNLIISPQTSKLNALYASPHRLPVQLEEIDNAFPVPIHDGQGHLHDNFVNSRYYNNTNHFNSTGWAFGSNTTLETAHNSKESFQTSSTGNGSSNIYSANPHQAFTGIEPFISYIGSDGGPFNYGDELRVLPTTDPLFDVSQQRRNGLPLENSNNASYNINFLSEESGESLHTTLHLSGGTTSDIFGISNKPYGLF